MFAGEVHPYADAFPMLGSDDLQAMADDIAEHGLLHPLIVDPDGRLLDGRNRLAACELAGVEPTFTVHEGDPLALIVTANTHRRLMSAGQVAAARAIALGEQGKRKNGRWSGSNVSEETSRKSLWQAGVILDHDPTLLRQVLIGTISLPTAYDDVRARLKDAETKAQHLARLRDEANDLSQLVTDDTLTLDEAWSAYLKRTEEERHQQEQRDQANRDRYETTAAAVDTLALISGPWMAEYDPDHHGPRVRDAFTEKRLRLALDRLEELIAWTTTTTG